MKSPITWTVGRRLTAIAGIGVLTTVVVGGVALNGLRNTDSDAKSLAKYEDARSLFHALDTRSSELKVDGLKAITYTDNASIAQDVQDDIATIDGLMAELEAVQLDATAEQTAAFNDAWTQYETAIADFVDAAIKDPDAMRARADEIQAANDQMDALLGGTIDQIEEAAQAEEDQANSDRSSAITLFLIAGALGVLAIVVLAYLIARSITRPLRSSIDVLRGFADGDLTQRAEERSSAELGELERALNSSIESVGSVIGTVVGSADAVAAASEELSASSQQIAAGAEETSVQAGVVSGAAEEVSRNVQT
ncbi:HAMP domain-containing protein, partial [Nocardioides sp. T2.26MG-1]|uniref:HAMP domain-containing protein n=1 Tax=Nocardioides sp. T2.26MG-1 TaxID=3041166 RepID=UPI00253F663D